MNDQLAVAEEPQIKKFNHDIFGELEVIVKDGKEYFPATDVAKALGYSNPHDALKKHCRTDGVAFCEVTDSLGRVQEKKFINDPNLYRLIVKSKLPQAEQFEKWVFEDVLPSIRKHGAYMTDRVLEQAVSNPDFMIGLLTNLKEEQQKRIEAERQVLKQQPLVTFAEACMQSDRSLKVGEVAKLAMKHGIKIGQKRLFEKLRQWGLMFKNSTEPTQKACERELFEITQGVKKKPNGEAFTWTTTYVTPKGQAYIIDRLKNEFDNEKVV